MTSAAAINATAAKALAKIPTTFKPDVLVGFDGFVDSIIDVVAKRESNTAYTSMATISEFGNRVNAAAGNSANFELVIKLVKIGGNGPIMANALCAYDYSITAAGVLGDPSIDPVFAPLSKRAKKIYSLGDAARTDALEFSDGKLMLGKIKALDKVTWKNLLATIGKDNLIKICQKTKGIAATNWTMTLGMTEIWTKLAKEILPLAAKGRKDKPFFFIDLADPAKRSIEDLQAAFKAMQLLQRQAHVVLGMNGSELKQVLTALGMAIPTAKTEWEATRLGCEIIQNKLGLSWTMCHLVASSACAWGEVADRGPAGSVGCEGFFDPHPKITTGAGDHFNAGFFATLLAGLEPAHCLQCGGATSGYYVRTGVSPSRKQAVAFLKQFVA